MRLFVILFSAGYSSRFRNSYKKDIPKPLIPFFYKKLIDIHLFNLLNLMSLNIKSVKVYINLHYKAFEIFKYVNENYSEYTENGVINFLFEPNLLGHIKTINKLKSYILHSDLFLMINCDSLIFDFKNYFNIMLDVLLNYQVDNIILVSNKKVEQDKKTYTHFEFQDSFSVKFKNVSIKVYKVKDIYKNEIEVNNYLNLYIGYSLFKITRNFNNILLSPGFKELNFIDFFKKVNLYSIKVSNFFEVTELKDYLSLINFYLFSYKYYF